MNGRGVVYLIITLLVVFRSAFSTDVYQHVGVAPFNCALTAIDTAL